MENRQWFQMSEEELYTRLKSSSAGLTRKEAHRRMTRGAGLLDRGKVSVPMLIGEILSDCSPLLLLAVAILAIIMEQGEHATVIILITAFYLACSIFLQIRSQAVIESVCKRRAPRVQVLREGKVFYVPGASVVPGDLLLLAEGDIVPADCRVLSDEQFLVHEGGVTQNSFSVLKSARTDAPEAVHSVERMENMLFALSRVTHGSCRAIVCAVNADTLVYRTRGKEQLPNAGKMTLQGDLKQYARMTSLLIPAFSFLLMLLDFVLPPHFRSAVATFLWGFSLCASGASSLFLLVGNMHSSYIVERAARSRGEGTEVTDLPSLEKLASVDALVFPAESTALTENWQVRSLFYGNRERDIYQVDQFGRELLGTGTAVIHAVEDVLPTRGLSRSDPFLKAWVNQSIALGISSTSYIPVDSCPAGAESRFHTALFPGTDSYLARSVGPASAVLPFCNACRFDEETVPMTPALADRAVQIIQTASQNAQAVLALAEKRTGYQNLRHIQAMQTEMTLVGFVIIEPEITQDFADSIKRLQTAGIQPIVVTAADADPDFCRNLVSVLRLGTGRSLILTGGELEQMDRAMLRKRLPDLRAVICANGDQRLLLVSELQRAGLRTAYVGAATCDIAPVSAADVRISCAMTGLRKDYEVDRRDTDQYGSQTVKILSGMTVRRATGQRGGIPAVERVLESVGSMFYHIKCVSSYLIASQWIRAVILFVGVCTRLTVLPSVPVLISGLLLDLLAVAAFATRGNEKPDPAFRLKKPLPAFLPMLVSMLNYALPVGALCVLVPVLSAYFGWCAGSSVASIVFVGLLMSQMALFASFSCRGFTLSPSQWHGWIWSALYYILTLALILLSLFWEAFGSAIGIAPSSAHDILFAFPVPAVLFIVLEITKMKNPDARWMTFPADPKRRDAAGGGRGGMSGQRR